MKYLLLLLISCNCWAGEYKFTFNMNDGRQLKMKQVAPDRWKALEDAGVFCGKFFGVGSKDMSEQESDEIIISCANPDFN
jgi:hypothetical protein